MKPVIVLAMHGAPPNDFPQPEIAELMGLHMRLEHAQGPERVGLERRYAGLEAKIRHWPRTPRNDPFFAGSQELAEQLRRVTEMEVVIGFNEFCAPSLDEAFEQAAAGGAEEIIVVTTMMTRGGEHSEEDIPQAIRRAQERYPDLSIRYAWPFDAGDVARFLAAQISRPR